MKIQSNFVFDQYPDYLINFMDLGDPIACFRKRNNFIKPFEERFSGLKDVFLKYLEYWKQSIMRNKGNFSLDERGKMLLITHTYNGFKIWDYFHIEFLLSEWFWYVPTESFSPALLEDDFGHQQAKGGQSDNLTIAAQRDIAPVLRGNVRDRYQKQKWIAVSEYPVKKWKKPKNL